MDRQGLVTYLGRRCFCGRTWLKTTQRVLYQTQLRDVSVRSDSAVSLSFVVAPVIHWESSKIDGATEREFSLCWEVVCWSCQCQWILVPGQFPQNFQSGICETCLPMHGQSIMVNGVLHITARCLKQLTIAMTIRDHGMIGFQFKELSCHKDTTVQ